MNIHPLRLFTSLAILTVLIAGGSVQAASYASDPIATPQATDTATPDYTIAPTNTVAPTATAAPTVTPAPIPTVAPTVVLAPAPRKQIAQIALVAPAPTPAVLLVGSLGNWSGNGSATIQVPGSQWTWVAISWQCETSSSFSAAPFVSGSSSGGHNGGSVTMPLTVGQPTIQAVVVSAGSDCTWQVALSGS